MTKPLLTDTITVCHCSTMTEPKYKIEVELIGEDGNAFGIIARVVHAMRKAKITNEKITEFMEEAMSGDYNNVLQTCMRWVHVT